VRLHQLAIDKSRMVATLGSQNGDSEATAPMVSILASVLDKMIVEGSQDNQLSIFSSYKEPPISLLDYLLRINTYARCSSSSFVLSLIYIDRLIERNAFVVTRLNIHRLIVIAVMVAAKFIDDFHYNNATFAKIGGITTDEINDLERDFLIRLRYSLHATTAEFDTYGAALQNHAISDDVVNNKTDNTSSHEPKYTEAVSKHDGEKRNMPCWRAREVDEKFRAVCSSTTELGRCSEQIQISSAFVATVG